jgi:hypothetical protein
MKFQLGDAVTDNPNGGPVGTIIGIEGTLILVDWGTRINSNHYTDLDKVDLAQRGRENMEAHIEGITKQIAKLHVEINRLMEAREECKEMLRGR